MATDKELGIKISTQTEELTNGMNRAKSEVNSASESIRSDLLAMASEAKKTIGAFIGFEAVKDLISTAINFDSLRMAINAASGSAQKGAEAMDFITSTSDKLGLSLEATAESYKTIAGAAMGTSIEGQKARDIFLSVTEASAVMGLSSENTKGALNALGQMISKGTVQSEELKGQLGDRLPGAFQIAAKAAGVTTGEFQKMLEQGKVMSEDFLPKFAQAMHDRFAGDVPSAANSARASMNRFQNSILELKVALAESGILEFAELVTRGWSYMASIISITVKSLASTIIGYFAEAYDFIVGGQLKVINAFNNIAPSAMQIDTTSFKNAYNEGKAFTAEMRTLSKDLDASATKTAETFMKRLNKPSTVSMSLEGSYDIGGLKGWGGDTKAERDKAARDAKRIQEEIQRINNQTVMLSLEGFDREEEKARQTYDKQLEMVGKTSDGRIAAENLLNAQLAEIQRKRDELAGSNLMAHAEKEKQIRISQIESAKQISLLGIQHDLEMLNLKKEYGDVNKEEELEALRKLKEKEFQIELKAAMDKVELMKIGSVELEKANADILAMQVKHGADMAVIDKKIAHESGANWSSMADNIQNSFGSAIGNLINFTTTWKNAFASVLQSMLSSVTQFIGKKVAVWLFGENAMTAATVSGNIMRVASNAWANITSLGITVATAIKTIAIYAWQAAAGAYAAISSIPFVGPFLAPAVAAGTVVAVLGMTKSIASAEGGFDIPAGVNPITQLHEQEMVLPKAQANAVREMADGGIGGGTNITIHAVDAKSVERLFKDHGGALVKSLKMQGRNFNS